MEAMIILRGYGEPQKLLARTLLVRSPKRKSIWIFQNVINSIFQQCEKETSSDSSAEESDCTGRALACSAATTRSKGHAEHQRGPLTSAEKALAVGLLPCCPCHSAQQHSALLMGSFTGASAQPGRTTFFKMSIFSPLYSLQKILLRQECLKPNFGLNATVCRTVSTKLLRVFVLILVF